MIELTRLNNKPIIVNAELIKFVEQAPDTVLTLITGDKIVVRESAQAVVNRVLQYRRALHTVQQTLNGLIQSTREPNHQD